MVRFVSARAFASTSAPWERWLPTGLSGLRNGHYATIPPASHFDRYIQCRLCNNLEEPVKQVELPGAHLLVGRDTLVEDWVLVVSWKVDPMLQDVVVMGFVPLEQPAEFEEH